MEDELYADGAAMVVFVDTKKQKPLRIPDDIRKLLAVKPLWTPSPERAASTELARFMKLAGKSSYAELHRWSVESSARVLGPGVGVRPGARRAGRAAR